MVALTAPALTLPGLTSRAARLNTDIAAGRRDHPLRDAWWDALTPDLPKIKVPMLECTSFSDGNLHSTGSMRASQHAGSADRHAYSHRGPKWTTCLCSIPEVMSRTWPGWRRGGSCYRLWCR